MTEDRHLGDLLNARRAAEQRRERDDDLTDAYLDGTDLPDDLLDTAADPPVVRSGRDDHGPDTDN